MASASLQSQKLSAMHRREPDYSNVKYCFHRVGKHACFAALAKAAAEILGSDQKLADRLIRRGEWDPFAFIDACQKAARGRLSKEQEKAMREIQASELRLLLEHFAGN